MQVVHGSTGAPERDHKLTKSLLEQTAETGETCLFVYSPPSQVAFGRRDSANQKYELAKKVAREKGYVPVERETGGRAVAHTGDTVAFAYAVATNDPPESIRSRYRGVTSLIKKALKSVGSNLYQGEPESAYCPGDSSLRYNGKIVGVAQRVTQNAAITSGCITVRKRDEYRIAKVLGPIYEILSIPFDPKTIGSVENSGGCDDPQKVIEALKHTFTDGVPVETITHEQLLNGH